MIHVPNRSEARLSLLFPPWFISTLKALAGTGVVVGGDPPPGLGEAVRVPQVWTGWLQLPLPPWDRHEILLQ